MKTSKPILRLALTAALALVTASALNIGNASAATLNGEKRPEINVTARVASVESGAVTYTITTLNHGEDSASNVVVHVPFDPQAQVDSVQFDREGPWVSSLEANSIDIQTGWVSSGGDKLTTTLRFLVPASSDGAPIKDRLTFNWTEPNGSHRSGQGIGNVPTTLPAGQGAAPFTVTQDGSKYTFSSNAFGPNDRITLWYSTPSGQSVALEVRGDKIVAVDSQRDTEDDSPATQDYIVADSSGAVSFTFDSAKLAPGAYSMVAYSSWSDITATAAFIAQ